MTTVLVFKTSIERKRDINILKPFLNQLLLKNGYWNVDLEDCDNILRVETNRVNAETVSQLLNKRGFYCEELH
ncbi:hypothetical protein KO566_00760 [Flavobacteriaceae bacterium XHP0103]|uniref:hypothetical protein n=1 Tax=Marixanthotalea marina TaxID=2844359 RepID=UPI002989CE4E|nr:hypothetical protein [Marixanthotalea marina]MBU3820575.1 hypothetical protein [Marixanthotalea marina]